VSIGLTGFCGSLTFDDSISFSPTTAAAAGCAGQIGKDAMGMTIAELALYVKGTLIGDGAGTVSSCNTIQSARAGQVAFIHLPAYADRVHTTLASCVILATGEGKTVKRGAELPALAIIEVEDPKYAWQQTIVKLHGFRQHKAVGISDKAVIHPTAKIGKNVHIHPFVVIGENCVVGDNTHLFPHVTLMDDVKVGSDTVIYPSVTVYERCEIGNRCILHAGCAIGTDGFSYATHQGVHHKIPQTGIVRLEDDVEIGVNTAVERAVMETTIVGSGTKTGNHVVIGHNCRIGKGNLFVSQAGLAGSTDTGNYVVLAGQVAVNGHLQIPDGTQVGGQSGIMANPPGPGLRLVGTPAMEETHAKRVYSIFMNLPELVKRVRELEKQVKRMGAGE
jgi:UDP-3-O-[3-hydroxymyristoyl] glucosamine N-acyltransferase